MNWLRRQSLTLRLAWWHAATALVVVVAFALTYGKSFRGCCWVDRQLRIDSTSSKPGRVTRRTRLALARVAWRGRLRAHVCLV
jgi:hypothetical protein